MFFCDLRILYGTIVSLNGFINGLTWEENTINVLNLYRSCWSNAARGFKLEKHNRQYIQPRFHAAQYKALKKLVFCQHPPLGFLGTFDMLQRTCSWAKIR